MSRGIGLVRSGRLLALLAGLLAGAAPAQGQSLRELVELALAHDAAASLAKGRK